MLKDILTQPALWIPTTENTERLRNICAQGQGATEAEELWEAMAAPAAIYARDLCALSFAAAAWVIDGYGYRYEK